MATLVSNALLKDVVPNLYHDFLHQFRMFDGEGLPCNRPMDHSMPLIGDKQPPVCPLYGMSARVLRMLREYLDKHCANGFIQSFFSPAGSPVLIVAKQDGLPRHFVHYQGLNAITSKNGYLVPLPNETLDRLSKARIYTMLDLPMA